MRPHTRHRRHGISHHPHSSAFALVRARRLSSASSPERTPSPSPNHPVVSVLFLSLSFPIPLFFCLYPTEVLPEIARNLSPRHSFRISCEQTTRVCTRRSSNLLIAIEQLSDGKLSYSCSLGPFPFGTLRSRLLCILFTWFYLPPRWRTFIRVSFQASDSTTNCIEPDIREKAYCR